MAYFVIWSDAAIDNLQTICDGIARRNLDAAKRTGDAILKHVEVLADFPKIGPAYPRGSQGTLRQITSRPYRIFYDVDESAGTVTVLHIRHGGREEPLQF